MNQGAFLQRHSLTLSAIVVAVPFLMLLHAGSMAGGPAIAVPEPLTALNSTEATERAASLSAFGAPSAASTIQSPGATTRISAGLLSSPDMFIENVGQFDPSTEPVLSMSKGSGQASRARFQGRGGMGSIVADSASEFSGTQGQNNWYYGYYVSPFTSSTFQQMSQFNGTLWSVRWGRGGYFTYLQANGGHPNGTITSGGRIPVEHWAVRRWLSEVAGQATISGTLAKNDTNDAGDGITGHILVDGVEAWSQFIAAADGVGVNYTITVTVNTGSAIDFAISPGNTDWSDGTRFTAVVQRGEVGCIRGHVVDALTGQGVPSVRIALWAVGGNAELYATTDANGNYEVDNMPLGQYQGWAFRDGYYDRKAWTVTVTGDGCNRGDFQMDLVPMEFVWPIDEEAIHTVNEDEDLQCPDVAGITSWFDHEYPVRWYGGEPSNPVTTTTLRDFTGKCWGALCTPSSPHRSYTGHEGIDIALDCWDRDAEGKIHVLAAGNGVITRTVTSDSGFGNHLVIDHGNGILTLYGHLQRFASGITPGQHVAAGQEIGRAGTTGKSTGTHLHFGVYRYFGPELTADPPNGSVVDSCGWLPRNQEDPWVSYGAGHPPSEVFLTRCAPQTTVVSVSAATSFTSWEGNVTINVPAGAANTPLVLRYVPVPIGGAEQGEGHDGDPAESRSPAFPENLVRVGPSFYLDAYTFQEQPVDVLHGPATAVVHYEPASASQSQRGLPQIYWWDPAQASWTALPTILNRADSTATAQTAVLGQFALLAPRQPPVYLSLVTRMEHN